MESTTEAVRVNEEPSSYTEVNNVNESVRVQTWKEYFDDSEDELTSSIRRPLLLFNNEDGSEEDKPKTTTQDQTSHYSLSSNASSGKSDISSNRRKTVKIPRHEIDDDVASTKASIALEINYEPQSTTATGSCLKAGSRSPGAATAGHVQFETPSEKECFVEVSGFGNFAANRSNENVLVRSSARPLLESSDYNSLKKRIKKRYRQTSGSSITSIGSSSTSTAESRTTEFERKAPDGGWGWMVVFASFMIHCIADGITMSFGVLYVEFLSCFGQSKSVTSWIGSLFMAIPLLAGPLASAITDQFGCRAVTIWGAIVACVGFFCSAFVNSMFALLITVGLITGIGLAVCYVAAIVVVAFYFEKRRSLATGIAVAGSGIGTFIFAPIIQSLLEIFGWRGCLIILAGVFLNMAVCGALMRNLAWTRKRSDKTVVPSQHDSVMHSSDTIVSREYTIPSLEQLKRLVQSGDLACLMSPEDPLPGSNIPRSGSLVLLPTFLNRRDALPKELLPFLSAKENAYKLVSNVYPHLLLYNLCQTDHDPEDTANRNVKMFLVQRTLQNEEQDSQIKDSNKDQFDNLTQTVDGNDDVTLFNSRAFDHKRAITPPMWAESDSEECLKESMEKKNGKVVFPANKESSSSIPVAPLRDMRITRQSMTYRGAMLHIHRYRLRASSCPNIYRNSMLTIAETDERNVWSYVQEVKALFLSCLDLRYCRNGAFLVFALSNFILYVFYDTVYLYLTDYAQGVGIPPDDRANLISAIGILNCIGMIFMGYIGDQPWCSPILVYTISMVACGLSVIVMPFITGYWLLAAASSVFGLFISANYALTAVILVELISLEAFSKSYGLLLLIQGIANLIGPPLVGFMADATGNYRVPFVVSGFFIVMCGILLFVIPVMRDTGPAEREANERTNGDSAGQNV